MSLEYDNYLAHYGVKGQKWGIRRFQNEDGTLKNPFRKQKPESKTWKSSDVSNLSDEELNRRLNRLNREKQYKELTASRATKVRKFIVKSATNILVATAVGALAGHARKQYNSIIESVANVPTDTITRDSGAIQFPKPKYT